MSILDDIVSKRKKDIERLGCNFGCNVPLERKRGKPSAFIDQKGVILEIKRASPSKGDIAPMLDVPTLAKEYAAAGSSAISVLTEGNYFKGSLKDLMTACDAIDEYALSHPGEKKIAILRKDFLIAEEEVDISYRCGSDAILLIARILETDALIKMVKRASSFGMTSFLELREEGDMQKLSLLVKECPASKVVCGVNARDLANFSIDLLKPLSLFKRIKESGLENAKCVFESGVRTARAASFVGSLGFDGLLLGEAAARTPSSASDFVKSFSDAKATENSLMWTSYAERLNDRKTKVACSHNADKQSNKVMLKICGITSVNDALYSAMGGADFLGFIFCKKSPRNVEPSLIPQVREIINEEYNQTCQDEHIFAAGEDDKPPFMVGVVTDCESTEGQCALDLARKKKLDFIQLHGSKAIEQFFSNEELKNIPHYCVVNLTSREDLSLVEKLRHLGEPRVLLDSKAGDTLGGTGVRVEDSLVMEVKKKMPLWIAGGITPENISALLKDYGAELVDISSGVEKAPGIKDTEAILELGNAIGR